MTDQNKEKLKNLIGKMVSAIKYRVAQEQAAERGDAAGDDASSSVSPLDTSDGIEIELELPAAASSVAVNTSSDSDEGEARAGAPSPSGTVARKLVVK